MDRSEQSGGETHLHKALADRLQKGTALQDETHFSAIRLKGTRGVASALVPPSGQSGPAVHEPLSKKEVLRRIVHAANRNHLYLVAETLVKSPVIFPGPGRTGTNMSEIDQTGTVDIDGDIRRKSVLKLFEPGEVTLEIVLECLKDGEREGTLIIYEPESDRPGPDGFLLYTIYGALKDVYVAETSAAGGQNDSDDDMDTDPQPGKDGKNSPAAPNTRGGANSARNKGRGSTGGFAARGRGGGAATSGSGRRSLLRDWIPSGPLLRILVLTCAGMLPGEASLAKRNGPSNSELRQIPSAPAVQVMSLGMARVPRQEAAAMKQRVDAYYSSNSDGPILLAHSRSNPHTAY